MGIGAGAMSRIQRIGVIGCGTMGAGLAELCAGAGYDVRVVVSSAESLRRGRNRFGDNLDRAVKRGRLDESGRAAILDRVSFTADLADLADRHLIVESVTESEPLKLKIFGALGSIVTEPDVILASNTSSLTVLRLAQATDRPGQVIGTHFFNPVPVMSLVELVVSPLTTPEIADRAEAFLGSGLGKEVVRTADQAGFVVNALLVPFLLAAVRMVESGHARTTDIDRAMTTGCGHPMGPLALADFTGLDTLAAVAQSLYERSGDACFKPPELLLKMVADGHLGKKSGLGFYEHRADGNR